MVQLNKKQPGEGLYYPQGATLVDGGVNFALFSRYAEGVDLLLFDNHFDSVPSYIIPMENRTRLVWHCRVEGLHPGQLYGYRVKGPYRPSEGLRFNPNRLLVDPYAKAISGKFAPGSFHLGYDPASVLADLSFNSRDNAGCAPKCLVIDDSFDWEGDVLPCIPMPETIIYEVHLRGFTVHRSSGVKYPGTYLGVIEKIPYLKRLGITALEFLPLHHSHDEEFLTNKGLTDYWGYNTLGFFAPDSRFSTGQYPGCQVKEFKQMVKALHKAGIEVILDVVYNHACEGTEMGPTLCFRGIDNLTYYKLKTDKRYYMDYSGCGNTLNFDQPQVVKMVMDSLRYWVEVMHVDGFRFDLASVLGRDRGRFDQVSSFFTAVHQDPVISRVKLIAEPWDVTPDCYQLGNFPVDWAEWNGKYRDCIRKFVKGDPGMLSETGFRLTGSSDLYGDDGRTPYHSINFITCHDGFTLQDLVSYASKHNESNLEYNRDGTDYNNSLNCGYEGETTDAKIMAMRKKLIRNFFTILMVSQGVPMILGGDEFMRTQKGNNNAYCQDNEISHFDWTLVEKNRDILEFVKKLIVFRKRHPHLRRKSFFIGQDLNLDNILDINWLGEYLDGPEWSNPNRRFLAFLIVGDELIGVPGSEKDSDILVILNAGGEGMRFSLPPSYPGLVYYRILDTSLPAGQDLLEDEGALPLSCQEYYSVAPNSSVILLRKSTAS